MGCARRQRLGRDNKEWNLRLVWSVIGKDSNVHFSYIIDCKIPSVRLCHNKCPTQTPEHIWGSLLAVRVFRSVGTRDLEVTWPVPYRGKKGLAFQPIPLGRCEPCLLFSRLTRPSPEIALHATPKAHKCDLFHLHSKADYPGWFCT